MSDCIKHSLCPVEYKVLVKTIDVEEVSQGGIILHTDSTKEKEQWAQTRAVLVAVGGNAFSDWEGEKPEAGDEIIIRQFTGYKVEDPINNEAFQVCNDKDISLIVKRKAKEVMYAG